MIESEHPDEQLTKRIKAFADRLSALRGKLSYREMARRSGYPHQKLQEAAAGKKFPDWKTVEFYVIACGGTVDDWKTEWQAINAALGDIVTDDDTPENEAAIPPQNHPPRDEKRRFRRLRPAVLAAGSVVVVAAIIAVTVLVFGNNRTSEANRPELPSKSTSSRDVLPTTTTPSAVSTSPGHEPPVSSGKATGTDSDTPGQQSTTTAPTNTSKTDGETLSNQDHVQEQRVVELTQEQGRNWVDIEYWRHDPSTPGELQINTQEVFTNLGAKLAIIPDTPKADRARCTQATGWRDRISFSELHIGSQLCALSHLGHYASMEVRLLPNSPASNGRFTFYGITWWNGE